ncbi:hypothetical protein ACLIMP_19075 [Novosphingobium aerophilum]|uniref:hypothetical protein n=1 Tax=Novosphingobium TaxID=165696 RepID=UPI0006CD67DA|nr:MULTISPECIES: hypothetical protein [unclassified Novosphingobium]KPH58086.1 hypothetical protein ADT71_26540 [Novosphingobium sp. ST904]MPS68056.1 hypothetical protein [Novosphingobium sp.]TCM41482.1 hypothetical protein EDF59_103234 [Novosphingobium sp. ST904]WRT95369.1 hypothetical protein U9J33_24655 [Novosphingobium sp. RL4]
MTIPGRGDDGSVNIENIAKYFPGIAGRRILRMTLAGNPRRESGSAKMLGNVCVIYIYDVYI